jgi:hypothetical protein
MPEAIPASLRDRTRYFAWFAASLAIFVVCAGAAIGVFVFLSARSDRALERALRIEPPALRLEDVAFADGDLVRGRFLLVNVSRRTVTINAVRTNCTCVASVAEGERKTPFDLAPSAAAEIAVTTTARAARGALQSYAIAVDSSIGDRLLPERFASLSFRVAGAQSAESASAKEE